MRTPNELRAEAQRLNQIVQTEEEYVEQCILEAILIDRKSCFLYRNISKELLLELKKHYLVEEISNGYDSPIGFILQWNYG